MFKTYLIKKAIQTPGFTCDWDDPAWQTAETAEVGHFYPVSSDHHPLTRVRALYNSSGIHGIFQVQDQYVRCLHSGFQEPVWQDACVEFFVRPKAGEGYFNFEMNCGGALLSYFIINPTPVGDGFVNYIELPPEDGSRVRIQTSLVSMIEPEIVTPVTWTLRFFLPFALLEKYVGSLGNPAGQEWRANFNKCAENNSHPHWATWQPLTELNFHSPEEFGVLKFSGEPG
jgi:hypothetical protein